MNRNLRALAALASVVCCAAIVVQGQTAPSAPTKVAVYSGTATVGNVSIAISPANTTIQPGAIIRYTAAVTGTSNTTVDWTSTGGQIAPDGTYTAGQTSGTFTVTAKLRGGTLSGSTNVYLQPSYEGASIAVSPGQSIQTAINAAPTGAVILLKAGVHRMQSLVPKSNQTFVGEPGAILSGARVLTSFSRSGAAWFASGQTQQGRVYSDPNWKVCRTGYPRCGYAEDLFINDVPLKHVDSLAAGGPGKWYFDYGADRIYFWDDPTGKKVETSVTPQAFGGSATAVTIRNLIIEKYAAPAQTDAVQLGQQWVIEDSEIRWNHFGGVGSASRSIARRNKVHHNGCFGFHGPGANVLIENNEISYNGYAGFDPYWGSGGSKWVFTSNLVVRGNNSHHNLGPGLWTDIDNIYTVYENNIVDDNERAGIFHEISYDAIIRYNTARRNGMSSKAYPYWGTNGGIEITSSRNVQVYGNTLVDNWQGITAIDDHRGTGGQGPWTLINLDVSGNTITSRITDAGAGRTGVIDTNGTAAFSSTANNRFRQNTYILGTKSQYFFWLGADRTTAQWQSYGNDTTGTFLK
jgi:parallel beta-helix repeat protein